MKVFYPTQEVVWEGQREGEVVTSFISPDKELLCVVDFHDIDDLEIVRSKELKPVKRN